MADEQTNGELWVKKEFRELRVDGKHLGDGCALVRPPKARPGFKAWMGRNILALLAVGIPLIGSATVLIVQLIHVPTQMRRVSADCRANTREIQDHEQQNRLEQRQNRNLLVKIADKVKAEVSANDTASFDDGTNKEKPWEDHQ